MHFSSVEALLLQAFQKSIGKEGGELVSSTFFPASTLWVRPALTSLPRSIAIAGAKGEMAQGAEVRVHSVGMNTHVYVQMDVLRG